MASTRRQGRAARWAALAGLAIAALGAAPAAAAPVTSAFDAGPEGWSAVGDSAAPSNWRPTGGNPGGYLEVDDSVSGGVMYWRAGPQFLGDRGLSYGATLTFDQQQSATDTQFDDRDVLLTGGSTTLSYDTSANPGTTWTRTAVPLTEAGWRNTSTNAAATKSELLAVLRALGDLRIRAEFRTGADVDGLDNVTLGESPDRDGDRLPDPADACPSAASPTPDGCPPKPYSGPKLPVRLPDPNGTYTLTVPRNCVFPGQEYNVALSWKRKKKKNDVYVKIVRADFFEGTTLRKKDTAAPFTHRFRARVTAVPGSTIRLRARAFIKVRRGKQPKKSVYANVKVCGLS